MLPGLCFYHQPGINFRMSTTLQSRTLTMSISREADAVYQFISNPANLPQWATAFCRSIRQTGSDWIMQTSAGEMKVRFVAPNERSEERRVGKECRSRWSPCD